MLRGLHAMEGTGDTMTMVGLPHRWYPGDSAGRNVFHIVLSAGGA